MMLQATGVCVAPEKTATKPIPAKSATGSGIKPESALPKVAPTKNKGVTSPPLNPAPNVNPVKSILSKKSKLSLWFWKESTMAGIPNPINFVVWELKIIIARIIPPANGLKGGYGMYFEKRRPQK